MLHTLCIVASLAALPVLSAAHLGTGYVRYSVATKPSSLGVLQKRQSETSLAQRQSGFSYTITLMVGTPGQNVSVQLDTGSSDLWMNPSCDNSGLPPQSVAFCQSLGRFDPARSSTYRNLSKPYDITYGGGNVSSTWSTDDISMGSINLKGQQFGLAYNSYHEPFGILGIGPRVFANQPQYTLFLDNLVVQNAIQSRAFSLDLQGVDNPAGSIVFGGVDTSKYVGALEKLPMVQTSEQTIAKRYWVNLDSVAVNNGQTSTRVSARSIPVLLDSGSSLMILPTDLYRGLVGSFPSAKYNILVGGYTVDCPNANQTDTLEFTFASKTIAVAYKDFVVKDISTGLCALGVSDANATGTDEGYILGDTFLRAAYVVHDQDNQNIHIAQAANCGTSIIPIGKGPNAVPSIKGQCSGTGPAAGQPTVHPSTAARLPSPLAVGAVLTLAVTALL